MFKHLLLGVCLLTAGCAMGYWPKLDGTVDQAKYQADVRDCQTATQGAEGNVAYFFFGIAGQAIAGNSDRAQAGINDCMTARSYHVVSAPAS